ncbi:hypothetical protein Tco_1580380 [Tanacetum coccineum]
MVDEFAPPKFFASVRGMEHDELFTEEVEVCCGEAAVEKSLRDETNALKERNAILEKEQNALDVKVTEFEASVASKERELTDLNALVTSVKWLLTHAMELAIVNCLNSPEYLSALGAAIGKAIEKDVAAYNPSAEVDYISALQQLQNVNFPLLAELKSNKDASIKTVMDILCLEGPLVDKLGLDELQPNVDQLIVPIHHSPDKVVIGATALSHALDVLVSGSGRLRKTLQIKDQLFVMFLFL